MSSFPYTFGIEEEYFLARADDGSLAAHVPEHLVKNARTQLGGAVTSELLQSQIEIASPIFHDMNDALRSMRVLRSDLSALMATDGLRLIAASTHPFGAWREQRITEQRRYDQLLSDFRIVGERNLVCGMHVHVAVPEGVDRIQLMNRAMSWLPLFLALSTSSPFWDARVTGLLSYRQAIYDEWPRSGIPDFFADEADYAAFAALLQRAGAIPDASYFWWAIRPAFKYPTLELRIADVCTFVEDAVALAALFRCLIAALVSRPQLGALRSTHTRGLIDENRWRAKRDGLAASLIDEASGTAIAMAQAVSQVMELVAEEADRLHCVEILQQVPGILARGTSAHAQLRIYNECRADGATREEALQRVVRWLMEATVAPVSDNA